MVNDNSNNNSIIDRIKKSFEDKNFTIINVSNDSFIVHKTVTADVDIELPEEIKNLMLNKKVSLSNETFIVSKQITKTDTFFVFDETKISFHTDIDSYLSRLKDTITVTDTKKILISNAISYEDADGETIEKTTNFLLKKFPEAVKMSIKERLIETGSMDEEIIKYFGVEENLFLEQREKYIEEYVKDNYEELLMDDIIHAEGDFFDNIIYDIITEFTAKNESLINEAIKKNFITIKNDFEKILFDDIKEIYEEINKEGYFVYDRDILTKYLINKGIDKAADFISFQYKNILNANTAPLSSTITQDFFFRGIANSFSFEMKKINDDVSVFNAIIKAFDSKEISPIDFFNKIQEESYYRNSPMKYSFHFPFMKALYKNEDILYKESFQILFTDKNYMFFEPALKEQISPIEMLEFYLNIKEYFHIPRYHVLDLIDRIDSYKDLDEIFFEKNYIVFFIKDGFLFRKPDTEMGKDLKDKITNFLLEKYNKDNLKQALNSKEFKEDLKRSINNLTASYKNIDMDRLKKSIFLASNYKIIDPEKDQKRNFFLSYINIDRTNLDDNFFKKNLKTIEMFKDTYFVSLTDEIVPFFKKEKKKEITKDIEAEKNL